MKPHPRIRKTVKWGGAVVTVLLVVVCIWRGWWLGFGLIGLTLNAALVARGLHQRARCGARAGFCPNCDYDRTGLAPQAVCPECGTAAPFAASQS